MEKQPTLQEWKKENAGSVINDYFRKYPPEINSKPEEPLVTNTIIKKNGKKKSIIASVLLTLFFGPLGLFYTSASSAIKMLILPIIGIFIGLLLPILCQKSIEYGDYFCLFSLVYWSGYITFLFIYEPICIILSITKAIKYNKHLK